MDRGHIVGEYNRHEVSESDLADLLIHHSKKAGPHDQDTASKGGHHEAPQ